MLQRLRAQTLLTRLVLVWFVLFVGSALATPLLSQTNLQMVCSGAGMKLVDGDGQGTDKATLYAMDCAGCLPAALPAPPAVTHVPQPSPLAHALQRTVTAHLAALAAPPLPSRGPPTQNPLA
ncbi:MAG: hypothetical protein RJA09_2809 [Pseudomonadota bacterium]|jgi:hypothetical protein